MLSLFLSTFFLVASGCAFPQSDYSPSYDPIPLSNKPTGNPGGCKHPTHFFPQPLYHSSETVKTASYGVNNETFLQQYQMITDFYQPGGPILMWQGAEVVPFWCIEDMTMYDYAKELGALLISIEHRYYGESIPFGLKWEDNAKWKTSSLKPLTLENIAGDTINLLRWAKKSVPGAQNSKAILLGGSYSAMLTIHMRNTYPEEFFGGIASSPPVVGQVSDPKDPMTYSIGQTASNIIQILSYEASVRIQNAFESLKHRIATNSLASMKEDYNLCTQPTTAAQAEALPVNFLGMIATLLEFDWPFATAGIEPTVPFPAEQAVADILALPDGSDDGAVLRASVKYYLAQHGAKCLDLGDGVRGGGMLPYAWARCHWLKHPDAYSLENSIFGYIPPTGLSAHNVLEQQCQATFGVSATDATPEFLTGLKTSLKDVMGAERLIVSRAEYDSIAGATFPMWLPEEGGNGTRPVYVSQGAHVSDLLRESKFDRDGVKEARRVELEIVKGWLGMA